MAPRVSVLMSVYNGERFLREAVDSILAQTFTDFEFVIVNDGSKDATAAILASYDDPRLKVFTVENRGLPAALNLGLEQCTTELVMRMDADDVAYPHRFATQLEEWERADRPDLFGSGADYINEAGKFLWSIQLPLDDETIRTALLAPNGQLSIIHPAVLFRKGAVLSCGGYDPYFKNGQDFDLWLRMTTNCRFGNSAQRLIKYRFHPCSDTAMAIRSHDGELKIGNWMKLTSMQKKLMIDVGEEKRWCMYREEIVSALKRRADIPALQAEAVVSRNFTEAKILYYSGKKAEGLLRLARLFAQYPSTFLKRISGRGFTDISRYLLDSAELRELLNPC